MHLCGFQSHPAPHDVCLTICHPKSPLPSPATRPVCANLTAHISLPRAGPCTRTSVCLCRWLIRFPFHFLFPPDGFSGWQFPRSPAQSNSITQKEILLLSSPGCCSSCNINSTSELHSNLSILLQKHLCFSVWQTVLHPTPAPCPISPSDTENAVSKMRVMLVAIGSN